MAKKVSGRRVRLGVIGVGGMGQGHCSTIRKVPEIEISAVCDSHAATADAVGAEHGARAFSDYRQLTRSGLCDAVLVATPHPVRPPIVIDAMKQGLHVLSEKPLAERVSSADKMVATAKNMNVSLGVMFQRRGEPECAKAIDIMNRGLLGKIQRTLLVCVEYRSQAYYDSGGWRATWSGEGGGVLLNQAPHILDLFVLLGGVPEWVDGRTETRTHHIEVEDHAEALLKYPGGGTGYMYCSTNEPAPGEMLEIFGDKGKLVYRNHKLELYLFEQPVSEFTKSSTEMWAAPKCVKQPLRLARCETGHVVIIRNFARHLLTGEKLIAPGHAAIHSLELANAVWLSAHRNKPVRVPINRRAYDAFLARKRRESTFVKAVKEVKRVTDPGGRV